MTPAQSRAARAMLDWPMKTVAERARPPLSDRTVKRFESGKGERQAATVAALLRVYTVNGITFDPDGVNVRLTVKAKGRK